MMTAPVLPDGELNGLLLTVEEAAHVLRIGRTTMYALVSAGEVQSVCIGRLRRIPFVSLEAYVASLLDTARPDAA